MTRPKKSPVKETALIDMMEAYECLPQNWRVIYHEAFRGNHLLFNQRDIEQFTNVYPIQKSFGIGSRKVAVRAAMKIMASPDLSAMKRQIDSLGIESKYYLFRLYLRYVASLREQIRASLN